MARIVKKREPMREADVVLLRLEDAVEAAGSAKAWAAKAGLSSAYVSDVRHGRSDPGPAILAALGMSKRVSYEAIGEARS